MEVQIRGVGSLNGVEVNDDNQIKSYATSESEAQHVNEEHEKMFSMEINETPTAADDCIAYVQNGSESDIVIDCLDIADVGADMMIYIKLGDKGSRNAANTIVPVNLNSGSGESANSNSVFETGADLDGGAATLSGGEQSHKIKALASGPHLPYDFCGKIILKKNQTLTIWTDTLNSVEGFLSFHYHA